MTTEMTQAKKDAKNEKARAAYAAKKVAQTIVEPAPVLAIVPVVVAVKGTKTTSAGKYAVAATGFTTRRQAKKQAAVLGVGHVAFKQGKGDYVVIIVPVGQEKVFATE